MITVEMLKILPVDFTVLAIIMKLIKKLFGKKEQKISIKIAADAIGSALFLGAHNDSEQVVQATAKLRQLPDREERLGKIFFEVVYFYLHLVDRFAFQYLGAKRRPEFFELVSKSVFNNYHLGYTATLGKEDADAFSKIFFETLNKRQAEYGSYKLISEEKKGLKGTLFWEFAKKLSETAGTGTDIFALTFILEIMMPKVGKLNELCKTTMSEIQEELPSSV